jgi:hypothetical protein
MKVGKADGSEKKEFGEVGGVWWGMREQKQCKVTVYKVEICK